MRPQDAHRQYDRRLSALLNSSQSDAASPHVGQVVVKESVTIMGEPLGGDLGSTRCDSGQTAQESSPEALVTDRARTRPKGSKRGQVATDEGQRTIGRRKELSPIVHPQRPQMWVATGPRQLGGRPDAEGSGAGLSG